MLFDHMFGIHGIVAVREGQFKSLIRDSFIGPSLAENNVPLQRLVSDLAFVVESSGFSVWEKRVSKVSNEDQVSNEENVALPNAGTTSDATEWLDWATNASREWLEHMQASEEMQTHLAAFMQASQGKKSHLALGSYFGLLVEYWLRNCDALQISNLKTAIRVSEGTATTLGSLKYVWQTEHGFIIHLECSVKFFCRFHDFLVGPHLSETLETRFRFAQRKIAVAQVARVELEQLYPSMTDLFSVAMIKGYVFYPLDPEDGDESNLFSSRQEEQALENIEEEESLHLRHLMPNHLRRWYSKDFCRVERHFSCEIQISRQEERWSVLPKLYWMSRIEIPEAQKLDYSLPMLDREDMRRLVSMHFSSEPRKQTPRRRPSGYVSQSPLLIAQLVLERRGSDQVWVERTRGFILPPDWDPRILTDAEEEGAGGVPNEPPGLLVHDPSKVLCEQIGLQNEGKGSTQRYKDRRTGSKKDSKSCTPGACELCSAWPLPAIGEDVLTFVRGFVASLYGSWGTRDERTPNRLCYTRGFASNQHTQHTVKALSKALAGLQEEERIVSLALDACMLLASDRNFHMAEKERKSVCRIVLRCCEQHLSSETFAQHLVQSSVFLPFVHTCVQGKDVQTLHMVFAQCFQALDRVMCRPDASHVSREKAVEYVWSQFQDLENWTEVESSVALGLMRCYDIRLEHDQVRAVARALVCARKFDFAIDLVEMHPVQELVCELFRDLVVVGRNFRLAQKVRESFTLDTVYPCCDLSRQRLRREEDLPMFETMFNWQEINSERTSRKGQDKDIFLLYVDSPETLAAAKSLFTRALESARAGGASQLIVGIDAEWGTESPPTEFNDEDVTENDGEHSEGSTEKEVGGIPAFLSLWQVYLSPQDVLLLDLNCLLHGEDRKLAQDTVKWMDHLLSKENTVQVGFGLHEDLRRLRGMLAHVSILKPEMAIVDSQCLLAGFASKRYVDGFLGTPYGVSLARWVALLLGAQMDKTYQCSDWAKRPLDLSQVRYAALDAIAPVLLVQKVLPQFSDSTLLHWATNEPLRVESSNKHVFLGRQVL